MFAYIKGNLVSATTSNVVVDVAGIGYQIFIPLSAYQKLPQIGSVVLLHTSFIVRELSQTLYGFLSIQEKEVFETLMSVSGIGPKLALCVIGHLSMQDLQLAIMNHDIATISKVPGIGKKTAERMILELRDKLNIASEAMDELSVPMQSAQNALVRDAVGALVNLGYNQAIAQKAIKKTLKDNPEASDLASLITHSLKNV